ncbi:MAG: hypothetical protein FWG64_01330 [Firmicutes bacterium]|nr:hypothetical protein [Bacillota bacterium]
MRADIIRPYKSPVGVRLYSFVGIIAVGLPRFNRFLVFQTVLYNVGERGRSPLQIAERMGG